MVKIATYARTLAIFMSDHLIGSSSSFRQIVFEKLFNHTLTKEIVPNYLQDLQKAKMNQKLVNKLRCSLSSHLVGKKSSKIILAKDIICTLALSQSIGSSREVEKVI
jgi:hypothetical protein